MEARLSCLGCNQIETLPVTLPDGRVVCATCPDLGELGEKITPNYFLKELYIERDLDL
jgi:hypothetical protein